MILSAVVRFVSFCAFFLITATWCFAASPAKTKWELFNEAVSKISQQTITAAGLNELLVTVQTPALHLVHKIDWEKDFRLPPAREGWQKNRRGITAHEFDLANRDIIRSLEMFMNNMNTLYLSWIAILTHLVHLEETEDISGFENNLVAAVRMNHRYLLENAGKLRALYHNVADHDVCFGHCFAITRCCCLPDHKKPYKVCELVGRFLDCAIGEPTFRCLECERHYCPGYAPEVINERAFRRSIISFWNEVQTAEIAFARLNIALHEIYGRELSGIEGIRVAESAVDVEVRGDGTSRFEEQAGDSASARMRRNLPAMKTHLFNAADAFVKRWQRILEILESAAKPGAEASDLGAPKVEDMPTRNLVRASTALSQAALGSLGSEASFSSRGESFRSQRGGTLATTDSPASAALKASRGAQEASE